MSTLLARRKNPSIEFYDTDLERLALKGFPATTYSTTLGVQQFAASKMPIRRNISLQMRYDASGNSVVMDALLPDDTLVASNYYEAGDFCRHVMDEIVENDEKEITEIPYMAARLEEIREKTMQGLLDNGEIPVEREMQGLGFIKNGGRVISTIEKLCFRRTQPEGILVSLMDSILQVPIDECEIEFHTMGLKFTFPNGAASYTSRTESDLTSYEVCIPTFLLEKEEAQDFQLKACKDVDELKDDRARFLTTESDEDAMGDVFLF